MSQHRFLNLLDQQLFQRLHRPAHLANALIDQRRTGD